MREVVSDNSRGHVVNQRERQEGEEGIGREGEEREGKIHTFCTGQVRLGSQ